MHNATNKAHLLFFFFTTVIAISIFLLLLLVLLFALLLRVSLSLLVLRNDIGAQFVCHVHHFLRTTGSTFVKDYTGFDFVFRLRQAAVGTKYEAFDILVNQLLQDTVGVVTIDNGPIGFGIVGRL